MLFQTLFAHLSLLHVILSTLHLLLFQFPSASFNSQPLRGFSPTTTKAALEYRVKDSGAQRRRKSYRIMSASRWRWACLCTGWINQPEASVSGAHVCIQPFIH